MAYTAFDNDLPAKIKEQADIVQIIGENVELKKAGVRFLGCCPFHNEKTPSFSVHPGQQFFYCFGCGASGDVFEFQMKYHNMDFPTALKDRITSYNVCYTKLLRFRVCHIALLLWQPLNERS